MRLPLTDRLEAPQQLGVVCGVRGTGTGEARRPHARLAAERHHAQARVVCERGQPAALGCVARLRQRVLDERRMRLVGRLDTEFALSDNLNADIHQQRAKLAQLAGIGRG